MAYLREFSRLSETAQWFICEVLAQYQDSIWQDSSDTDIQIIVNGIELPDLDAFLEYVGQAIDGAIEQRAAEKVVEQGWRP